MSGWTNGINFAEAFIAVDFLDLLVPEAFDKFSGSFASTASVLTMEGLVVALEGGSKVIALAVSQRIQIRSRPVLVLCPFLPRVFLNSETCPKVPPIQLRRSCL